MAEDNLKEAIMGGCLPLQVPEGKSYYDLERVLDSVLKRFIKERVGEVIQDALSSTVNTYVDKEGGVIQIVKSKNLEKNVRTPIDIPIKTHVNSVASISFVNYSCENIPYSKEDVDFIKRTLDEFQVKI